MSDAGRRVAVRPALPGVDPEPSRRPGRQGANGFGPRARGGVWLVLASVVAVGFGLLTIREGGSILFGDEAARAAAGSYVPFVLQFNFVAGFAYVIAGIGLWMQRRWAAWLAIVVAATTALTFVAFGAHVYAGGGYKRDTVIAMSLRTLVWVAIAVLAHRRLIRRRS